MSEQEDSGMTLRERMAGTLVKVEEGEQRALDYRANHIRSWLTRTAHVDAADLPVLMHPVMGPILEVEGLRFGAAGRDYGNLIVGLIHSCEKCGTDYLSGDLYGLERLATEAARPTPHRCPPAVPALVCPILATSADTDADCMREKCAWWLPAGAGRCAMLAQGEMAAMWMVHA